MEIWDDGKIEPGSKFADSIQRAMAGAGACILLVTPQFLASDYIRTHELPYLLRVVDAGLMQMFWLHVIRTDYASAGLAAVESAHDPVRPLAVMSPSELRETLTAVCLRAANATRSLSSH
jgi:hypothetical protein